MEGRFQSPSSHKAELEEGTAFTPRFDAAGLICAVVADAAGGGVLMVAYMNAEALRLTLETGEAHFWSRSRNALWRKGETSGNRLLVQELLTVCDQDVLLVKARLAGRRPAIPAGSVVSIGGSVEQKMGRSLNLL